MLDDLDRLQTEPLLFQLLQHYASLAEADPEAWQIRLGTLEGAEGSTLSKLHGELIAFGWIELNVGAVSERGRGCGTTEPQAPVVSFLCRRDACTTRGLRCYRVTSAGRKALRLVCSHKESGEMESQAA